MALPAIMVPGAYSAQAAFDTSILGNTVGIPAQRQQFTLLPLSGLTGSGATLTLEGCTDALGTSWAAVSALGQVSGASSSTVTVDDNYKAASAGYTYFRWRVSTAGTRSIAVFNGGGSQPQDVNVVGGTVGGGGGGGSIPTGTAGNPNAAVLSTQGVVGGTPLSVSQNAGPWTVSWSGQSVGQAGTWTVGLTSGTSVAISGSVAVTGTFYQATQPISAAALPLPTGAATEATLANVNTRLSGTLTVNPSPTVPTAVVSTALEGSHVLKSSAGGLLSCYATTGSTAGYLMLFDATTAPADGAVTPVAAIYCPAQSTTSLDYPAAAPRRFATGITAVFSSTGPFAKTASATAFLEGLVVA